MRANRIILKPKNYSCPNKAAHLANQREIERRRAEALKKAEGAIRRRIKKRALIEDWRLRTTYGLSATERDALQQAQHGRCACCGREAKPRDERYGEPAKLRASRFMGQLGGLACHSCICKASLQSRRSNATPQTLRKQRDRKLRAQAGITLDAYNLMLQRQQGRCYICGRQRSKLCASALYTNPSTGLVCRSCIRLRPGMKIRKESAQ